MFEIVSTHGSLLVSRFHGVVAEDAMSHCIQTVRAVITKADEQHVQMICVTDVREAASFTKGASDVLVWLLRRNNAARTVNAFLARGGLEGNVTEMIEVLRQGQSDLRQAFTEEAALMAWVSSRLQEDQKKAVVAFLRRPLAPVPPTMRAVQRPSSTSLKRQGS